jgi:hypothetical protein
MYNCKRCRVTVATDNDYCPLCGSRLYVADSAQAEKLYPERHKIGNPKESLMTLIKKSIYFLFFVGVTVSVLVNLLADSKIYWSIIVAASAVNMCVLLSNILFSNRSVPAKIALQLICVIANILAIENFSGSKEGWGLNMAVPFVLLAATLLLALIAIINYFRGRSSPNILILCIICLGFVPLLLIYLGFITLLWPSIIASTASFVTVIGLFVFTRKKISAELKQRFHI